MTLLAPRTAVAPPHSPGTICPKFIQVQSLGPLEAELFEFQGWKLSNTQLSWMTGPRNELLGSVVVAVFLCFSFCPKLA